MLAALSEHLQAFPAIRSRLPNRPRSGPRSVSRSSSQTAPIAVRRVRSWTSPCSRSQSLLLRRLLEQLLPPLAQLTRRRFGFRLPLAARPDGTKFAGRLAVGAGGVSFFFRDQLPLGDAPAGAGDEVDAQPRRHLVEHQ